MWIRQLKLQGTTQTTHPCLQSCRSASPVAPLHTLCPISSPVTPLRTLRPSASPVTPVRTLRPNNFNEHSSIRFEMPQHSLIVSAVFVRFLFIYNNSRFSLCYWILYFKSYLNIYSHIGLWSETPHKVVLKIESISLWRPFPCCTAVQYRNIKISVNRMYFIYLLFGFQSRT